MTDTIEVYWNMPNGGTPDNVTWPQDAATSTDCGGYWQVDTYPAGTDFGPTLEHGEDYGTVISWRFEAQPACVEPEPTPTPTPEPTVVPTPEVTPPAPEVPVVAPEVPVAAPVTEVGTVATTAAPELAETGVDPLGYGIVAAVLVAVGVQAMRLARKRGACGTVMIGRH